MASVYETRHLQDMTQEDEVVLYTIGHSNLSMEHLICLLKSSGIETLVDIRSKPFSSYVPHFNASNLEQTLTKKGMEYVFLGDCLGGYPRDPDCYVHDEGGKARIPDYNVIATKKWFKQGLTTAVELGQRKRVVLMCSEEDPHRCHRHCLIGRELSARGVTVKHVRANGNVEDSGFGNNCVENNTDSHQSHEPGLTNKAKREQLSLFPVEEPYI